MNKLTARASERAGAPGWRAPRSGAAAAAAVASRRARAVQPQPRWRQPEQQQQQQQQPADAAAAPGPSTSGRRAALLAGMLGGAAAALLSAPGAGRAEEAGTPGPLEDYMQLESKGKLKDRRALDDFRAKHGIRRLLDGRVQLRDRKGEWFTVRLDMEVPGALLLRDSQGKIYAIETEGLPQVDLSDDYVLLMLFTDGSWQDQMQPIEYEDADSPGKVVSLTMTEQEFREFVGILKGIEEDDQPADKGKKKKK